MGKIAKLFLICFSLGFISANVFCHEEPNAKHEDYAEKCEEAKEVLRKLVALCDYLEKEFDSLKSNKQNFDASFYERKRFIELISKFFPHLKGDIRNRVRKIVKKIEKIESEKKRKAFNKILIIVFGGVAAVALIYLFNKYVKKIQSERDEKRDQFNDLIRDSREDQRERNRLALENASMREGMNRLKDLLLRNDIYAKNLIAMADSPGNGLIEERGWDDESSEEEDGGEYE
jgi:hypothetical protein